MQRTDHANNSHSSKVSCRAPCASKIYLNAEVIFSIFAKPSFVGLLARSLLPKILSIISSDDFDGEI